MTSSSSSYAMVGLVLFLAVAVHTGAGLRCWVCTSSTSQNCRDPFNSSRVDVVDCERMRSAGSHDLAACQKMVESINEGQTRVVRKCVFSREPLEGKCAEPTTLNFIKMEHCSTCDTEQCNAAPGALGPAPLAAGVAATLLAWTAARPLL